MRSLVITILIGSGGLNGLATAQPVPYCFETRLDRISQSGTAIYKLTPLRETEIGFQWTVDLTTIANQNRTLIVDSRVGRNGIPSSGPLPFVLPTTNDFDFIRLTKSGIFNGQRFDCPVEIHSVRALDPQPAPALSIWTALLMALGMGLFGVRRVRCP